MKKYIFLNLLILNVSITSLSGMWKKSTQSMEDEKPLMKSVSSPTVPLVKIPSDGNYSPSTFIKLERTKSSNAFYGPSKKKENTPDEKVSENTVNSETLKRREFFTRKNSEPYSGWKDGLIPDYSQLLEDNKQVKVSVKILNKNLTAHGQKEIEACLQAMRTLQRLSLKNNVAAQKKIQIFRDLKQKHIEEFAKNALKVTSSPLKSISPLDVIATLAEFQGNGNPHLFYEHAKTILDQGDEDPKLHELMYFKGCMLLKMRHFKETLLWWKTIKEEDPRGKIHYSLLLQHYGFAKEAITNFEEYAVLSTLLKKKTSEIYLNLGSLHEDQENFVSAIASFEKAYGSGQDLKIAAGPKLLILYAQHKEKEKFITLKSELESLVVEAAQSFLEDSKKNTRFLKFKDSWSSLAFSALYLEKFEDLPLFLKKAAESRNNVNRYEPRSLQTLTEDLLMSHLYTALALNSSECRKENEETAIDLIQGVKESLRLTPQAQYENLFLIRFYLKRIKITDFIKEPAQNFIQFQINEILSQKKALG
ncbi:hypothetical protein Bealeia1_01687 [Candidatus Bealeia paramacronuclearis]|uniref:Tetratricopeptide repeat protein n=1 Tax=Candidatus Bealeia paramacronuclearis TaxID=1921001 RepID=A0ABZ2C5U3_9PROT|nr:hypothetical protein [Candidatus Bealeia paramacronuclearis]